MIFPVVQFIIFWVIVNANSLLLSFKEYTINDNGIMVETLVGLKNFLQILNDLVTLEVFINCIKNSLMFYGISIAGGTICSLGFSYYIYKRGAGADFFKVMLYMPHILSTMVIAMMYNYFCEYGFPKIMENIFSTKIGGFGNNEMAYIAFFNFVMAFGGNMLIYTGTMASISDSIIEAAQIDGVNALQEFFYVIMPRIFTTFALFIVTGMITIFNGQANMFNFYGLNAPIENYTFGYYIYVEVKAAGLKYQYYPYLASLGLALTFVAIPLIFTCRWLLSKYGPKDE
jgi:ABC-type sugar transport system permease subunit